MLRVTIGFSDVPDALAVPRSAPANSRPWSDGLIGEASIRTMTSSGFGSGVATVTSEISTTPAFVTMERSCTPLSTLVSAMSYLRCWERHIVPPRSIPSATMQRMTNAGPWLDRALDRLFGDTEGTRFGSGWISGTASVFLGGLALLGVVTFWFPGILTTAQFRGHYSLPLLRALVRVVI